jgi:deoxyribonuclease V
MPSLAAGVDVSYAGPEEGVAAYALVDVATAKLVWSTTVRRRVGFPYITTYLSFRELPLLVDVLNAARQAGRMAEVVLVDGSGMLHPRRAGVACHLGVIEDLPTIGVTKKLLAGRVELSDMNPREPRPVLLNGRPAGIAIRSTAGSRRPIFVSPGHRTSLPLAETLVLRLLTGHRLPEPLYWADRLSRLAKQ